MNTEQKFERICERMISHGDVRFSEYCSAEGLSEICVDNMFYAHFGMSGEEFLNKIKASSIVIAI
jgi:hypothetical protein